MRVLLQRVSHASVTVGDRVTGQIGSGLLVLLGIEDGDEEEDLRWLCGKIAAMRIFSDDEGKMNLSLREIGGRCLVVSQFTLHASTKKGNRPSYTRAARPEEARPLYEKFLARLKTDSGAEVEAGVFGANMEVSLINDGPVTIWMDSKSRE